MPATMTTFDIPQTPFKLVRSAHDVLGRRTWVMDWGTATADELRDLGPLAERWLKAEGWVQRCCVAIYNNNARLRYCPTLDRMAKWSTYTRWYAPHKWAIDSPVLACEIPGTLEQVDASRGADRFGVRLESGTLLWVSRSELGARKK